MILRYYQVKALRAIQREWESVNSTLLVLPTGTGKTVVFAHVIKSLFPRRVLVIAHRKELITQAADKIRTVTGFRVDVEMADDRAQLDCMFGGPQVVVSSVQTQCAGADGKGRMTRFDPTMFGALVIDEGHHSTGSSYLRMVDYYRAGNLNLKLLGVTATPDRADEEALGQVYDTVAFDYEILDAIQDGWLVPVQQQIVEVAGLDFSHMRTTAGDLNGADLARVMEEERNLHEMATPTIEIVGNRRGIVFTASVAQAERMCDILNRHREGSAAWVCGKTPKEEREKLLAAFSGGRIQYVCNCGVLTEGFDDAGVECIVMGRPTKSRSLYAQMCGRATRPLPGVVDNAPDDPTARQAAIASSGKKSMLIIDFVGNAGRHKLMTSADILGGKVSEEAQERAVSDARKTGTPVDMAATLAEVEEEIKAEKLAAEARRLKLKARAQWQSRNVDPFDVFQIEHPRESRYERHLSEKQRGLLEKQGIDPDSVSAQAGQQLLNEIFRRWKTGLCSYKQARCLRRHGYTGTETREEAGRILDGIFGGRK